MIWFDLMDIQQHFDESYEQKFYTIKLPENSSIIVTIIAIKQKPNVSACKFPAVLAESASQRGTGMAGPIETATG